MKSSEKSNRKRVQPEAFTLRWKIKSLAS